MGKSVIREIFHNPNESEKKVLYHFHSSFFAASCLCVITSPLSPLLRKEEKKG
ncbi:MAG: hypothetical protein HS132_12080 [Planctomycetia bacterium]|nr:hypothetical protein [Planctomycetia bacterium]